MFYVFVLFFYLIIRLTSFFLAHKPNFFFFFCFFFVGVWLFVKSELSPINTKKEKKKEQQQQQQQQQQIDVCTFVLATLRRTITPSISIFFAIYTTSTTATSMYQIPQRHLSFWHRLSISSHQH